MAKHLRATYFRPQGALAIHSAAINVSYIAPPPPDVFSGVVVHGSVAVVSVRGPLEHYAGASAFDSYDGIVARAESAFAQPTVRCVVIDYDTPGGVVSGCFEAARALRAMAAASGKRLVTFAQNALSAGYALASSGDVIVAAPSALLGSVGIIEQVVDQTAAAANAGVRIQLVTSGARKSDGNPNSAISTDALSAYQRNVDAYASQFFDLIAEHRSENSSSVTPEYVDALEASIFVAPAALSAGLADAILSLPSLIEHLSADPGYLMAIKISTPLASANSARAEAPAAPPADKPAAAEAPAEDENKPDYDKDPVAFPPGSAKRPAEDENKPDYDKALKAIAALAESDDDKGEMCRRMLGALKAAAPAEEPAAAAPAEEPAAVSAAAKAAPAALVETLARQVFARSQELSARAELAASRPDLAPAVRKALDVLPLADARALVEATPRAVSPVGAARAALASGLPAQGAQHTNGTSSYSAEATSMDRLMGLSAALPTVEHTGNVSTFRAPARKSIR